MIKEKPRPDLMVGGGRLSVRLAWLKKNLTGTRMLVAGLLGLSAIGGVTLATTAPSPAPTPAVAPAVPKGLETRTDSRLAVIEHRLEEQGKAVAEVRDEQKRQTELLHELKGGMEILIQKEVNQ